MQSAVHIAIMKPLGVYSERGQFPLRAEARRLDDDRLAGVPDNGAAAYLIRSGPRASPVRALPAPARRARTARPCSPGHQENRDAPMGQGLGHGDPSPEMALGQRRHPPAQANHAPPETDYGTQPNTERSYGMTTKTTSARAQCKGSVGPSSCGIAQAGGATPASRGSEP